MNCRYAGYFQRLDSFYGLSLYVSKSESNKLYRGSTLLGEICLGYLLLRKYEGSRAGIWLRSCVAVACCDWPLKTTSLLFTPPQFLSHNTASSSSSLRPLPSSRCEGKYHLEPDSHQPLHGASSHEATSGMGLYKLDRLLHLHRHFYSYFEDPKAQFS